MFEKTIINQDYLIERDSHRKGKLRDLKMARF